MGAVDPAQEGVNCGLPGCQMWLALQYVGRDF